MPAAFGEELEVRPWAEFENDEEFDALSTAEKIQALDGWTDAVIQNQGPESAQEVTEWAHKVKTEYRQKDIARKALEIADTEEQVGRILDRAINDLDWSNRQRNNPPRGFMEPGPARYGGKRGKQIQYPEITDALREIENSQYKPTTNPVEVDIAEGVKVKIRQVAHPTRDIFQVFLPDGKSELVAAEDQTAALKEVVKNNKDSFSDDVGGLRDFLSRLTKGSLDTFITAGEGAVSAPMDAAGKAFTAPYMLGEGQLRRLGFDNKQADLIEAQKELTAGIYEKTKADTLREVANYLNPVNEREAAKDFTGENNSILRQLPNALGQAGGNAIVGAASGGAAVPLLFGINSANAGRRAAEEAIAAGKPETAMSAFLMTGVATGGLETVADVTFAKGVSKLFGETLEAARPGVLNKLKKAAATGARQAAKGGAVEGITEGLQQVATNAVAKKFYDENRDLFEGVGESVAVGALTGAILGGATGTFEGAFRFESPDAVLGQVFQRNGKTYRVEDIEESPGDNDVVQRKVTAVPVEEPAQTVTEPEESPDQLFSRAPGSAGYPVPSAKVQGTREDISGKFQRFAAEQADRKGMDAAAKEQVIARAASIDPGDNDSIREGMGALADMIGGSKSLKQAMVNFGSALAAGIDESKPGGAAPFAVGQFDEIPGADVLEQFAGISAQTGRRDRKALERAEAMQSAGANREEIRRKTGWFPGDDGKWRREIPDNKARLKTDQPGDYLAPARDLLAHDKLFAAYPALAETDVRLKIGPDQEMAGEYNIEENIITASGKDRKEAESVLLHEMAHWIQQREGFDQGAGINPRFYDAREELSAARAALKSAADPVEKARLTARIEDLKSEVDGYFAEYQAVPGEVEARRVQQRRNWPDKMLRDLAPFDRDRENVLKQVLDRPTMTRPPQQIYNDLTDQDKEIFTRLEAGWQNADIARDLGVTRQYVVNARGRLGRKFGRDLGTENPNAKGTLSPTSQMIKDIADKGIYEPAMIAILTDLPAAFVTQTLSRFRQRGVIPPDAKFRTGKSANRTARADLDTISTVVADRESVSASPSARMEIAEALGELPEQTRAVIEAKYLYGDTDAAIMDDLGISARELETHIGSGIAQLRDELADLGRGNNLLFQEDDPDAILGNAMAGKFRDRKSFPFPKTRANLEAVREVAAKAIADYRAKLPPAQSGISLESRKGTVFREAVEPALKNWVANEQKKGNIQGDEQGANTGTDRTINNNDAQRSQSSRARAGEVSRDLNQKPGVDHSRSGGDSQRLASEWGRSEGSPSAGVRQSSENVDSETLKEIQEIDDWLDTEYVTLISGNVPGFTRSQSNVIRAVAKAVVEDYRVSHGFDLHGYTASKGGKKVGVFGNKSSALSTDRFTSASKSRGFTIAAEVKELKHNIQKQVNLYRDYLDGDSIPEESIKLFAGLGGVVDGVTPRRKLTARPVMPRDVRTDSAFDGNTSGGSTRATTIGQIDTNAAGDPRLRPVNPEPDLSPIPFAEYADNPTPKARPGSGREIPLSPVVRPKADRLVGLGPEPPSREAVNEAVKQIEEAAEVPPAPRQKKLSRKGKIKRLRELEDQFVEAYGENLSTERRPGRSRSTRFLAGPTPITGLADTGVPARYLFRRNIVETMAAKRPRLKKLFDRYVRGLDGKDYKRGMWLWDIWSARSLGLRFKQTFPSLDLVISQFERQGFTLDDALAIADPVTATVRTFYRDPRWRSAVRARELDARRARELDAIKAEAIKAAAHAKTVGELRAILDKFVEDAEKLPGRLLFQQEWGEPFQKIRNLPDGEELFGGGVLFLDASLFSPAQYNRLEQLAEQYYDLEKAYTAAENRGEPDDIIDQIADEISEVSRQAEGIASEAENRQPLAQKAKGFFDQASRTIGVLPTADASTGIHELGHLARIMLEGTAEGDALNEYYGATDGNWTVAQEEAFARHVERYVYDGKPPEGASPTLANAFKKLAAMMRKIYADLVNSSIMDDAPAEVRDVLDRVLLRGDRRLNPQKLSDFNAAAKEAGNPTLPSEAMLNTLRNVAGEPNLPFNVRSAKALVERGYLEDTGLPGRGKYGITDKGREMVRGLQPEPEQPASLNRAQTTAASPSRIMPAALPGEVKPNREVIFDAARALGATVKYKGHAKRTYGTYTTGNSKVSIRYENDLDTTAHELGHAIDDRLALGKEIIDRGLEAVIDAEILTPTFQATAEPGDPIGIKRAEGIAEFIRAMAINPAAAKAAAPEMAKLYDQLTPEKAKKAIDDFGKQIRAWEDASPGEKILANTDMDPDKRISRILKLFSGAKKANQDGFVVSGWDRVATKWLDDKHPFIKAVNYAEESEKATLLPRNDPRILARLLQGVGSKQLEVIENGMIDAEQNRVLPGGVDWLFEPLGNQPGEQIDRDMRDSVALMIAERTAEMAARFGRDDVLTGIGAGIRKDLEIADATIFDLQKDPARYQRLKETGNRYRQWADANLRYMVEKGRLSQEAYDNITAENTQYVALNRLLETAPGEKIEDVSYGAGKNLGSVAETIKKLKGSTKTIKNPYISLLEASGKMMAEADRNEVLASFVDLLENSRKLYEGDTNQLASIGSRVDETSDLPRNTITIYRDGQKEVWQFDDDVHKALKGLGQMANLPLILTAAAKTLKWGVTNMPAFAIRNLMRDTQARFLVSRSDIAASLKGSIPEPGSNTLEKLKLAGGDQAGHYTKSAESYLKLLRGSMRELASDKKSVLVDPAKWARFFGELGGYRKLLEKSEQANRLAEYKAAFAEGKKRGYDDINAHVFAAAQARDLMDFAVAGEVGRVINQIIPFFNAAIQGTKRNVIAAKENPQVFAVRFALFAVLPTVLLRSLIIAQGEEMEDEYEDLPPYLRDMYWNIKIGPDNWLRIPKNFETGVIASISDRIIGRLRGYENAMDGFGKSLAGATIPVDGATVYGPFKPLVEAISNYDHFRGKSIVSPFEKDAALDATRNGERIRNSQYASRIGQAMQVIAEKAGLSQSRYRNAFDARVIDNTIKGMTGNFGDTLLRASNTGRDDTNKKLGLRDVGLFVDSPSFAAQSVQKVMKVAVMNGLDRHKSLKPMNAILTASSKAKSNKERDEMAKELREEAKRILPVVEAVAEIQQYPKSPATENLDKMLTDYGKASVKDAAYRERVIKAILREVDRVRPLLKKSA